jgi:uncharacterized protein (TIGR02246 family)
MKLSSAITLLLAASFGLAECASTMDNSTNTKTNLGKFREVDVNNAEIDDAGCRALFGLWNDALATNDPYCVAERNATKPVLLPTISDEVRTDYEGLVDYFKAFLPKGPQGTILEGQTEVGDGWCQDMGVYEFKFGDGSSVKARYSFVYVYEDGEWRIAHHHSSQMPEDVVAKQDITEDEVKSLFGLWNDALATGNPRTVAQRYAKDSTLLPTVSDTPRKDFDSRVDYFVNFLKLKPQGVILDSNVVMGTNWAQDAGIYEFTLGNGDKVKARYTFVYVYEDGEWKISQHHSSKMPEEVAAPAEPEPEPEPVAEKKTGGFFSRFRSTPEVAPAAPTLSSEECRDLFYLWNDALATNDPVTVAQRYASKAVLLPTVSDEVRYDYEGRVDYFTAFLQKGPQGKILEGETLCGEGWCQDMGVYEFTFDNGDVVKARYSFVYVYEDGEWKISHHHSSQMPESVTAAKEISEDEVKSLFYKWNDALATGNPRTVAQRYSEKAVLLPTVSDTPRKDFNSIVDYFVNFLKLEPQGVILDSNVVIGTNWAQDAGIYEFTLGGPGGDKVKARYTFIYVYEDGEWKISQHHSSKMPEEVAAAAEVEVKKEDSPANFWANLFSMDAEVPAEPEPEPVDPKAIDEEGVRNLFTLWNDALASNEPTTVADRYAKKAVLLPTVSDDVRYDYDGRVDYFTNFLQKGPQGKIIDGHIQIGDGWCSDMGVYEFTFDGGAVVQARYSFVYVFEDGEWKISHHHSSQMPEKLDVAKDITEKEVKSLFGLWNDALATGNPRTVAARYANDSVLLPTVSDEPRKDYNSRVDYFTNFLKLEPQGVILDSNVVIGTNWCQDAGIYEFTMGNGDKVKARYTFVYVYEEGEWKISQHHSSKMPEEVAAAAAPTTKASKSFVKSLSGSKKVEGTKMSLSMPGSAPFGVQRSSSTKLYAFPKVSSGFKMSGASYRPSLATPLI